MNEFLKIDLEDMGFDVNETFTLQISSDFTIPAVVIKKIEAQGYTLEAVSLNKNLDKIVAMFIKDEVYEE